MVVTEAPRAGATAAVLPSPMQLLLQGVVVWCRVQASFPPPVRGEARLLIHQCQTFLLLMSLTLNTVLKQYFTLNFLKSIIVMSADIGNKL